MKKAALFILYLLCGVSVYAQITLREPVSGKVVLPVEDDLSGIGVTNLNTRQTAVTDIRGNFMLNLGNNDSISISSVQFNSFIVVVDKTVMESKKMYVYVKEVVNELPEVVVSPNKLTGNLSADVKTLRVITFPEPLTPGTQDFYADYDYEPNSSRPLNRAMLANHTYMVDGLNFVNLFKLLLVSSKKDEVTNPYNTKPGPIMSSEIRKLYKDDFFQQNLDISFENINDFIQYADENGLSEQMLKKGNELDLIQFLIEQSKKYKKKIAKE